MIRVNKNYLQKIITGDESWCSAYDRETKCQSEQWIEPNSP